MTTIDHCQQVLDNRLAFERRVATEALRLLRSGQVMRCAECLAHEVSMGEVQGEWIAMAIRALARRGGLRRLVEETARHIWLDIEAGEIDVDEIGCASLGDRYADRRCTGFAVQLIRDALQEWRFTHCGDYYTETPRGRRLRGGRSWR